MEPPSGDAAGGPLEPGDRIVWPLILADNRINPVIMVGPGPYLVPAWDPADEEKWGESPLKAALPVLKEMDERSDRLREMTRMALGIGERSDRLREMTRMALGIGEPEKPKDPDTANA